MKSKNFLQSKLNPFHLSLHIFPFMRTQVWMSAYKKSLTILFYHCDVGTMSILKTTHSFHTTCSISLHLMRARTPYYS
jgi:hypothetical protein